MNTTLVVTSLRVVPKSHPDLTEFHIEVQIEGGAEPPFRLRMAHGRPYRKINFPGSTVTDIEGRFAVGTVISCELGYIDSRSQNDVCDFRPTDRCADPRSLRFGEAAKEHSLQICPKCVVVPGVIETGTGSYTVGQPARANG